MEIEALSAALVKAQRAFAPALKKSTNPHFRSKYVDLAGCVEAVIDALNANGIFLMQPTQEAEGGVSVSTVFLHESGEQLNAGTIFVPASKHDAQGYGSALTYARRYSLMAACGIAPEDDDGNAATRSAPKHAARPSFDEITEGWPALDKEVLRDIAAHVSSINAPAAVEYLEAQKLEAEQKTAVWDLLDSKTRAAIKKAQTEKDK